MGKVVRMLVAGTEPMILFFLLLLRCCERYFACTHALFFDEEESGRVIERRSQIRSKSNENIFVHCLYEPQRAAVAFTCYSSYGIAYHHQNHRGEHRAKSEKQISFRFITFLVHAQQQISDLSLHSIDAMYVFYIVTVRDQTKTSNIIVSPCIQFNIMWHFAFELSVSAENVMYFVRKRARARHSHTNFGKAAKGKPAKKDSISAFVKNFVD